MAYINRNQNRLLHALLNELGRMPEKEAFVLIHTNGRTNSSKEMGTEEAQALINTLKAMKQGEGKHKNGEKKKRNYESENRQRRKILAICYELGWTVDGKLDFERINNFCEKRGTYKKKLNAHSGSELPKLVSQFEKLKLYDSEKSKEGENQKQVPPNPT